MSPISISRDADGIWTVAYFGRTCGFAERIKRPSGPRYRVVSIHGEIGYVYSLGEARSFCLARAA